MEPDGNDFGGLHRLLALEALEQDVGGRAARASFRREQLDENGHARRGGCTPPRRQDCEKRCAEECPHLVSRFLRGLSHHECRALTIALSRPVILGPLDEDALDGLPEVRARDVVHWIMNARPDARITRFLPDRPDVVGARWEEIREDLRSRRGVR